MKVFHKLGFSKSQESVVHYRSSRKGTIVTDIKTGNTICTDEDEAQKMAIHSLRPYRTEGEAIIKLETKDSEEAAKRFQQMLEECALIKEYFEDDGAFTVFGTPEFKYNYTITKNGGIIVVIKSKVPRLVASYVANYIKDSVEPLTPLKPEKVNVVTETAVTEEPVKSENEEVSETPEVTTTE